MVVLVLQDTRQLVVHQLVVKVAGWKKITVPISVDKVGIFFRELEPSNDDELDNHVRFVCTCVCIFLSVSACVLMASGSTMASKDMSVADFYY